MKRLSATLRKALERAEPNDNTSRMRSIHGRILAAFGDQLRKPGCHGPGGCGLRPRQADLVALILTGLASISPAQMAFDRAAAQ